MRILSLSDIHGELPAFEMLLERLRGKHFDVVLIAGDMGDLEEAKVFCNELAAYDKPVFYVLGNWDSFSYDETVHEKATHIHLNHQKVGEWVFLGYSGSAANGYAGNHTLAKSQAEYQKDLSRNKRNFGSLDTYRKSLIFKEISTYILENGIDVEDLILVTHDRLYALPFYPLLYVFGHRHEPKHTVYKGVHLVNTSAISMHSFSVRPPPDTPGNFCITELDGLDCQVDFFEVPSPYVRQPDGSGVPGYYKLVWRNTGKDAGIFFQEIEGNTRKL